MEQSTQPLVIGRIPFLVCAPFFHMSLEESEGMIFRDGSPSLLNNELQSGLIDAAPSSSIEYARHFRDYLLLPGISTSSGLEMKSVLLLSRRPWPELNGVNVRLSTASATSNVLFQILSRKRYAVRPKIISEPFHDAYFEAGVFIGDEALRQSSEGMWPFRYDLADEWFKWQSLPFSFGLWIVREACLSNKAVRLLRLRDFLFASIKAFRSNPRDALNRWNSRYPSRLPMETMLEFYESADYNFGPEHETSLKLFFQFSREEGFIEDTPVFRYLEG